MVTASSMQRPAGLAGDVRLGSLNENEEPARQELFARVAAGTPHEDMRDWMEMVDAMGERRGLAVSLGLPVEIGTWELMEEWERRMDQTRPVPLQMVEDGPITEHVLEGDEVDLLRFPTPLWHPQDGGRYLGTGDAVITRNPDSGWINTGTYRVMIHDRNHTGLYISPGKHGRIH